MVPKPTFKTLFMGLENSGKTSIVYSLRKNANLLDYISFDPTKNYDTAKIEDEDSIFHIWDLGGQEQYRKDHIKNLNTYLTGTNKIIYVIDIQNKEHYDLALQYFENILKILKKENVTLKLSIFLHKFDPNAEIEEEIVSELINKIIEKIPPNIEYDICKTCVYTVFKKISII